MGAPATDLFGDPWTEPKVFEPGRKPVKQRGHAAAPGTGPKGETCGSCHHLVRVPLASKNVFKCGLARRNWTGGAGTDIRCKDAACGFWRAQ